MLIIQDENTSRTFHIDFWEILNNYLCISMRELLYMVDVILFIFSSFPFQSPSSFCLFPPLSYFLSLSSLIFKNYYHYSLIANITSISHLTRHRNLMYSLRTFLHVFSSPKTNCYKFSGVFKEERM